MEEQIRQSNRELIALSRLPAALPGNEIPPVQNAYDPGHVNKETQELLKRLAATQERQTALALSFGGTSAGHHVSPGANMGPLSSPGMRTHFSPHQRTNSTADIDHSRLVDNSRLLERQPDHLLTAVNARRNLQMISPTELGQRSASFGGFGPLNSSGRTPPGLLTSQQQVAQLSQDISLRNSLLRVPDLSNAGLNNAALTSALQETFLRSLNGAHNPIENSRVAQPNGIDPNQALTTSVQTSYLNQLLIPHILAAQAQALAANSRPPVSTNHSIPPMPALLSSANIAAQSSSSISPGIAAANVPNNLINLPTSKSPNGVSLIAQQNPLLMQSLITRSQPIIVSNSNCSTSRITNISPVSEPENDSNLIDLTDRDEKVLSVDAPVSNMLAVNASQKNVESLGDPAEEKFEVPNITGEMRRASDPVLNGLEPSGSTNTVAEFDSKPQGLLVPAPVSTGFLNTLSKTQNESEQESCRPEKDTLVAIIQKNIMGQLHMNRRNSVITSKQSMSSLLTNEGSNLSTQKTAIDTKVLNSDAVEASSSNSSDSGSNPLDTLFKGSAGFVASVKGARKRKHRPRETVSAADIFNDDSSRSGNSTPQVQNGLQTSSPAPNRDENTLISALAADNGHRVSAILGSSSIGSESSASSSSNCSSIDGGGKQQQQPPLHVNLKKNWAVQYQKQETMPDAECQDNNEHAQSGSKKLKLSSGAALIPQQQQQPGVLAATQSGGGGKSGSRRSSRETIPVSDIFIKDKDKTGEMVNSGFPHYQQSHSRLPLQSGSPDSSSGCPKPVDVIGAYLQSDTCCVITPKPNLMCRDCRARGTNSGGSNTQSSTVKNSSRCNSTGKTACRFSCFRKLKNSKNKYPSVVGFLQAELDATEEDLAMWKVLETNFETLSLAAQGVTQYSEFREYRKVASRPDKAIFRIEQIANFLCSIIHREQLVYSAYREPVHWKRFLGGCRELCDVCSTSVFNFHWMCPKCGFAVCLDCYDCYAESKLDQGVLGTAETQQDRQGRVWLKCTKVPHVKECLKLIHFIPVTCLEKLLSDLHQECKRWGIYHQCQLLQNVDNDKFPTMNCLMDKRKGEQLLFQSTARPTKSLSPMCAVTSTSSPSPPASSSDVVTPGVRNADVSMDSAESHVGEQRYDLGASKPMESSTVGDSGLVSVEQPATSQSPEIKLEDSTAALKDETLDVKEEETKSLGHPQIPINVPIKSYVVASKSSSEFDIDVNLKRRRSLNSFIDKLVESSLNNPIVDAKISREEYLRLLKLSTLMETKFPRNWELGLKEPDSVLASQEQPSTTQNVHSDYVIALREKAKNISRGKVMQFNSSQISHVEQAQFSVEWRMNKPIIVRGCGVNNSSLRNYFTPDYLSKSFGSWKVDLVDCRTGRVHPMMSMENFLQGFVDYSARKQHFGQLSNGCDLKTVLKLKDWPPGNDFTDIMPKESHQLLMESIPLGDYTSRAGGTAGGTGGPFNLATSLPSICCAPDMGPKMFIAYGSPNEPSVGSTNLHTDMSDAVNILLFASSAEPETDGCDSIRMESLEQSLLLQELKRFGGEEATQRMRNGEVPGAVWNIFNTDDNDKLRKFLRNEAEIIHKAYRLDDDPIHDQDVYLSPEKLAKLKREEGVEPFTFVQFQHDSVFIPAGAAHQVRNLNSCIKAAVDFVSPERVKYCLRTTEEYRNLSDRHANHEDKLQIKSVLYHAVKDCLSVLKNTPTS